MAKLIFGLIISCAAFCTYDVHAVPSLARNEVIKSTSTLIEATPSNVTIPTYYISSQFGWHKIYTAPKSWHDARTTCSYEGAHLAIINSAEEEAFLLRQMSSLKLIEVWIGVYKDRYRDRWMTVTGKRLDDIGYVHWALGEPNNADGNEYCVALDIKEYGLNDRNCVSTLSFMCERSNL